MNHSSIPRPFSYYQETITAFRCGRTAEGNYHLMTVLDNLIESFRHIRAPLTPHLLACMQRLMTAKENNDQTAIADLLQFELPEAGLFNLLPLRRLQLKFTPPSAQRSGLPVTVEIEAEVSPGFELEYGVEPRHLGPGPSPITMPPVTPPQEPGAFSPQLVRNWNSPDCPGRYSIAVYARLRGSSERHLMTDLAYYRLT